MGLMTNKVPLDDELKYVLDMVGKPLEMRLFPLDDKGDERTVAAIHAINLLKIAETTMPESGVHATPTGISEVEYKFLVNLFDDFMGLPKEWFDGRWVAYSLMKSPEIRMGSEGMQRLYSGFRDFFQDLNKRTKFLILNSFDQEKAYSVLRRATKNDATLEKALNYIQNNRGQNWSILHTVDDCWGIVFPEQYYEALRAKPQIYLPKIQKTEAAVKLVKGNVHQVLKDGKIDEIEKEIVRDLLLKRFEGFEEINEHCIDQMYSDISVKDILFNLALNGRLDHVDVPPTISELEAEIIKISDKAKKAKNLLRSFEGKVIDRESLPLAVYALQYIIGIRGPSNCELVLADYGVSHDALENLKLHDMPAIKKLAEDPEYLANCEFPEIKALALANPTRF